MMSIRAIARSAPRTLTRLGSTTIRQTRVAQSSSLLRALAPLRTPRLVATFSSSSLRQAPENEADQELLAKLESELQFEADMKDSEPVSATINDFIENSPYELKDVPGKQDVYLVRKIGDETITVSFSVSDILNMDSDLYNEDNALTDEEMDSPEGKQLAETEAEEGMGDDESTPAVPCRLNIVIEKPNKGSLNIEAVAQDGAILVENFYYYQDAKMAHSSSADAVHAADDVYPGPPFGSLDEDLQLMMERYLEERGISQAMAIFVPEYMDFKEQREYHHWLKNVKEFVEA